MEPAGGAVSKVPAPLWQNINSCLWKFLFLNSEFFSFFGLLETAPERGRFPDEREGGRLVSGVAICSGVVVEGFVGEYFRELIRDEDGDRGGSASDFRLRFLQAPYQNRQPAFAWRLQG